MDLDFSSNAEPVEQGLDFSSQGDLDFSAGAEPVEESKRLHGLHRAVGEASQVADMVLGTPEFLAELGVRGAADTFYALRGDENPAVKGAEFTREAADNPFNRFLTHPTKSILNSLGMEDTTSGTTVDKLMNKVSNAVGHVANKTGDENLAEAVKQGADVLMGGGIDLAVHGAKYLKGENPNGSNLSVDTLLAAMKDEDKAPTPDAQITPERQFNTDVNAIPENISDQVQMDRKAGGLSLEPLPEKPVAPVDDGTIDFEKVDPATLKNSQSELDFGSGNEMDFRDHATPEQGADFIDTLQNDLTQPKPEIPYQASLPGVNKGKFGQGGAVDPSVFEEAFNKLFKKDEEPAIRNNASGESSASVEAINRLKQQNDAGLKMYELDPERGTLIPLNTADRVDKRPAQGRAIVQQDAHGNITIVDNNSRFGNVPLANRSKSMLSKEQQPLGGTGKKGFGQGGAVSFGTGKASTLERMASKLSQEEWTQQFGEKYPEYANRPDVAARIYQQLNPPKSGKPVTNLREAIEKSPFLKGVDKGLGVVSTRIGNISKPVLQRAVNFEQGLLQNTHRKIARVDDFVTAINKELPKDVQGLVNAALLDNDTPRLNRILSAVGRDDLKGKYEEVRNVLKETGHELQSVGRLENLREDYFPRIVKDVPGLLATFGEESRNALETRLKEAKDKAQNAGVPFGDLEESKIINQYMRNTMRMQYRPGFSKERKLDSIPDELQKFYATPTQAIHTYLRNAVQEIETSKFFGRDAVKDPETHQINISKSIGSLVAKEMREGKIKGEQAEELHSLLESRFGNGNKSSNLAVQTIRDAANIGLLGNIISTVTQGGDLIAATYLNGLRPTLMSAIEMAAGRSKVSMKDFGLEDHISEEFVNQRKSAKLLNAVYKSTGFSKLDSMGKNLVLNSTIKNAEKSVQTPAGLKNFTREWGERFGDDFPQLVQDLREGKITDLTQSLAFSKLSKIQPVTKLELPQKYLDMPNGRIIYMLKSFALKQADLIRNDAWNEIKKGDRESIQRGISNLAKYSLVLGISGATTGYVKDWIMGRDIDPELSDIPLNVLKTFGFADYTMDKIKQGRVGEALGDLALPPYKMFDIVMKEAVQEFDNDPNTNAKGKSLNYVPFIGRVLYEREYGGADEYNEKERSKQFRDMVRGED